MKRYPCVLQDDAATCGVACLATVARRFGLHPSWFHLKEAAGSLIDGTNFLGLSVAARELGFMARAVSAAPESLPHLPTPFVAHVLREGNGHFVVVHEVRKKHLVIADPAEGLTRQPHETFVKGWTGKALLLTRDQGLPAALEAPSLFHRLVGLVLPHRRLLLESFAAAGLITALAYGTALLFSTLIDQVYPSGETWTLHLFAVLAVAFALINGLFSVINNLLIITIGQRVSVHLMFPTLQRLLRLPASYFDSRRLGDILNRFGAILDLKSLVTRGPATLALDGLILSFTSIALVAYDLRLGLAVLAMLPVMLLVTLLCRIPLRRLYLELMTVSGKLDSQIVSMLGGISTVKAYSAERIMEERTEPLVGRLIRLGARMETLGMVPRIINRILSASSIILIYWLGGLMVMRGQLTLGQLVFCVTLAGTLFPPFLSMLDTILQVQQALANLDRATDIVDAEPETGSKTSVAPARRLKGQIRLENVSFRYGHEEDILNGVSLTIEPGEILAIVGESGSGKSTLLKLLQRFYAPREGRILLDGMDLRDWDVEALRSRMSYVDQDCRTFAGSILDNLQLAGEDITRDQIYAATRALGLSSFIEKMPGRYDTDVGEAGARLSGGERQRLALARALARRPKLLLLDEATSHLDPAMERDIFLRLKMALDGATIVLATHRVALAREANRVIVMNKGRIVEQGTPADLIGSKGTFARFCGESR